MAREDVTSTYLTDANLTDEKNNWSLNSTGGNHAWNADKQYHESWHNTFTISQTVTLPNGYYEVSIQAASEGTPSINANLTATSGETSVVSPIKGTIASWNFEKIAELFNGDNEAQRIYATVRVQNGSLTIQFQQTKDDQWIVYGNVKLVSLTEAEYQNAIAIQAFKETNTNGWRNWTNGGNNYGFGRERFNETAYTAGKVLYQTITDLPSGKYDVVMHAKANKAHHDVPTGDNIAQIYANYKTYGIRVDDMTSYEATTTYKYTLEDVMVTDGNLELGIQNIATGGNWYVVSLYNITYKGEDLSDYETPLTAAKTAANAVDQDDAMNATVLSNLQSAISTYGSKEFSSFTTVSEIRTAINALNDAATAANNSIDNYAEALAVINAASSLSSASQTIYANNETISAIQSAYTGRTLEALTDEQKTASSAALAAVKAWDELKAYADALVAVENTNAEANATLTSAISAQNTAATGATTTAAVTAATTTLKTAMITYAGAANPTSGNRFDLTFMMTNPSLDAFAAWTRNIPGWASEETDGNYQAMVNDSKTVGDKDHFYEYWSNPAKASGKFALYNAVTLPAGTYSMSCYAFAENQYAAETVNGVFFYANDTQGSAVTSTRLSEQSISFINESEQEVKIGLKTQTGNTRNWMGIGYVKLYKEYTDNTTYDITTTISNADVAVTVDGVAATSAKALKTVTLTVSNITEGYVISGVTATYNDGEVKNLDVANPSTNVYTYQQPAYDVTVTINVVVDKSALNTAIADATAARKSANEGAGVFQIPAASGTALATAITTAQGVYDNASATVSQVADAVTAINAAKTTYEGATLNAPDAEKRYNVSIVEAGKAWDGNAVTFIAGGRGDMGNYGVKYLASANANLNQALKFTAVAGEANTYKVSAIRVENGSEQYLTTGSTYDGGNNDQICTTDDASKAMWIKIEPTSTDNQFQLRNMSANKIIANNNNDDMYTAYSANFTIAEASQASVAINIDSDVKYATRIFPFTPLLPSGVKAYSCGASVGDVLTLVEVAKPAANVPYILEATSGYTGDALTGWGTAAAETYTVGWLTGVYTNTTAQDDWYVLQKNNGKVAFYLVDTEVAIPTVGANRCYLTVTAGARPAFFFDNDETTGINALNALTTGKATIYDVNGRQVPSLQKGMNIVKANGKSYKVVVK